MNSLNKHIIQELWTFNLTHKNTLDLHGVRHNDVDRLVENFILLEQPPLTIICGNSDRMQELVRKVLNRHNIEFTRWNNAVWKIL